MTRQEHKELNLWVPPSHLGQERDKKCVSSRNGASWFFVEFPVQIQQSLYRSSFDLDVIQSLPCKIPGKFSNSFTVLVREVELLRCSFNWQLVNPSKKSSCAT